MQKCIWEMIFRKIYSFCLISFFFPFLWGRTFLLPPWNNQADLQPSPGTQFPQVINNFGTGTKSIYKSNDKVVYHERAEFCFHGDMQPKAHDIGWCSHYTPPSSWTLQGPALGQARPPLKSLLLRAWLAGMWDPSSEAEGDCQGRPHPTDWCTFPTSLWGPGPQEQSPTRAGHQSAALSRGLALLPLTVFSFSFRREAWRRANQR